MVGAKARVRERSLVRLLPLDAIFCLFQVTEADTAAVAIKVDTEAAPAEPQREQLLVDIKEVRQTVYIIFI